LMSSEPLWASIFSMVLYHEQLDQSIFLGGPFILGACIISQMKIEGVLDKMIENFVPIVAPWKGSVKAAKAMVSGMDLGIGIIPYDHFKKVSQNCPSTTWLLPHPSTFGNIPIITTSKKAYTANDFKELLHDMGLSNAENMYEHVKDIVFKDLLAPNVNTYHIYSSGVNTAGQYIYTSWESHVKACTSVARREDVAPSSARRESSRWADQAP